MKHSRGYTFVEIMVVVALLGILMVGVIGLFLTNLKISNRATALSRVKQEGDYSSSTIERLIRYAKKINTCAPNMSTLDFQDTNDINTTINLNASIMRISTRELTSDKVIVSLLDIDCTTTPGGDLVKVSYTVTDSTVSSMSEDFTTRVVLRNK